MASDQRVFRVIAFLDAHRLDHGPVNYGFAYQYLFGDDDGFRSRVSAIIDGGVRISAEQVVELSIGLAPPNPANDVVTPALEQITQRILGIITSAASDAVAFRQDLTTTATDLLCSDARNVHLVVANMIAQTERAEAGLAKLSEDAAALREQLTLIASVDQLDNATHLLNRLAIEARLSVAVRAPDKSVTIAMVALDRFGDVTRDHGGAVAERVLRALGETVRDHCVPHRVGRWDEGILMVLFEGAKAEHVTRKLKTARVAFGKRSMRLRENDRPLDRMTFSAAIALCPSTDPTAEKARAATIAAQARRAVGNIVAWHGPAAGGKATSGG